MKISLTRRLSHSSLAVVALCAFLVSCGGGGSAVMNGSGGSVRISLSASGGTALLSAIPADALAARSASSGFAATDHPSNSDRPRLQSIEVTFSSISARNANGELVAVAIALPVTLDLLASTGGNSVELPVGFLPADTYQGLVVTVSAVSLLLEDGTRITIEPPGDGWTSEIATQPFTVVDGQPTTVELILNCDLSLRWLRDHFEFHPVFDCRVGSRGDDDSGSDDGSRNDHNSDGDDSSGSDRDSAR